MLVLLVPVVLTVIYLFFSIANWSASFIFSYCFSLFIYLLIPPPPPFGWLAWVILFFIRRWCIYILCIPYANTMRCKNPRCLNYSVTLSIKSNAPFVLRYCSCEKNCRNLANYFKTQPTTCIYFIASLAIMHPQCIAINYVYFYVWAYYVSSSCPE